MDLVLEMDRLPENGETLLGRCYSYIPGGRGANQAVAVTRLGAEVTFVGRVGRDAHGSALREHLSRKTVDSELLAVDEAAQTGFAVIPVEESGQNRIVVYVGANLTIRPQDVEEACRQAAAHGVPVVLDAGPVRDFDLRALGGLEVISPNETETRAYSGLPCGTDEEAARACRKLAEMTGSRFVVLKLGERGAFLYESAAGRGERVAGFQVKAVDTTAAGDAFTAGLAAQYLRTGELPRAVRYANAAGALAVTRLGAQPSMPHRAEVESFLQKRGLEP
jgi:ribokinase